MELRPMDGVDIKKAGYEDGALEVRFATEARLVYVGVLEEVYRGLLAADDPDRYYRAHVKYSYPFER